MSLTLYNIFRLGLTCVLCSMALLFASLILGAPHAMVQMVFVSFLPGFAFLLVAVVLSLWSE